jgi:molybdenum cofactor biosynthesis enzyme MoaA
MKDTFCVLPFIHLQVRNGAVFAPCCHATGLMTDENGDPFVFGQHLAATVFNSKKMKELRSQMIRGKVPASCKLCFKNEEAGLASYREASNKKWLDKLDRDKLIQCCQNDFSLEYKPKYLHLNLSSLCNLKCRMCWAGNSSKIAADTIHSQWAPINSRWISASTKIKIEAKHIADLIGSDPAELREVYFTGGEPFIIREIHDCLQYFIDQGIEHRLRINLNTNATLIDAKFVSLLKRFHALSIHLSVDGTGRVYEYIRYPAKWNQVAANIRKIRQEFLEAEISAVPTVQIYNVMNLSELSKFCRDMEIRCFPLILHGPLYLSVANLPQNARNKAADRLEIDGCFPQIASYLREAHSVQTPVLIQKFMHFTNDLDKSRGQDFLKTYPELVDYFEADGYPWNKELLYAGKTARSPRPNEKVAGPVLVDGFRISCGNFEKGGIGYVLSADKDKGVTASKKTEKSFGNTIKIKARMKSALNEGVRNGMIVFGENQEKLASAVIFIGSQTLAIQGPFIEKAEKPEQFDQDKVFDTELTVNLKEGTVTWKVDGSEVKTKMKEKPASINYIGYSAWNTKAEFSEPEISGD